jgi:hypothetical protein
MAIFKCERGHYSVIQGDDSKLAKKAAARDRFGKPKLVCPQCFPNNIPIVPVNETDYLESLGKQYVCERGHVAKVSTFGDDVCNISWSKEVFENVKIPYQKFDSLVKRGIMCRGLHEGAECGLPIHAVDDSPLEPPQLHGFKVKTRVGDVWDKNRCPSPKATQYDSDGGIKETDFSQRARQRAKNNHLHVFDEKSGKQVRIKKTRKNAPKGDIK